jgi:hypothetical protein
MTEVQDVSDRAAKPPVCPKCGKADHVQKMSAIPDWPAEYGPPSRPGWFDLLGVVLVAGGLTLALAVAFILLSLTGDLGVECIAFVAVPVIGLGFARLT